MLAIGWLRDGGVSSIYFVVSFLPSMKSGVAVAALWHQSKWRGKVIFSPGKKKTSQQRSSAAKKNPTKTLGSKMNRTFARRICALLFIVITSLVVACAKDDVSPVDVEKQAFEDLRSEIREVIDDPARASEAIAAVDLLEDDISNLRDTISVRRTRVRQLNADYDTTREDFESFLEGIQSQIRSHKREVSKTHLELLSVLAPDERSAISKARTKAMDAVIKSIQSI